MKTSLYIGFIRKTTEKDGIKIADRVNKMALASGAITQIQYCDAARMIAKKYFQKGRTNNDRHFNYDR